MKKRQITYIVKVLNLSTLEFDELHKSIDRDEIMNCAEKKAKEGNIVYISLFVESYNV